MKTNFTYFYLVCLGPDMKIQETKGKGLPKVVWDDEVPSL